MTLSRRRIPLRSTCAQPHDCPAPLRMKVLAQIPFFAGLSEAELLRIDDRMISRTTGYGCGWPTNSVSRADEGVDGTLIQLPLSRADVAALTGSTAESVSRAMSQLRKDGVIDSGRGWTSVLDRDALAALAAPTVSVAS